MPTLTQENPGTVSTDSRATHQRAREIYDAHMQNLWVHTDKLFAGMLFWEWLAAILLSVFVSPYTWAGRYQDTHMHVWTALILGTMCCLPPILVAWKQPGTRMSRYSIAIGQMLYSAVLIHITGGRIETHFHVFGSLAFMSFYRDWRVLVPATLVVVTDHILRGIYFPQSVYGVDAIEPWRWFEHAWWVFFEDIFLIQMCLKSSKDMMETALHQAEIEEVNANIESIVRARTEQLDNARFWAKLKYQVMIAVAKSESWHDSITGTIKSIAGGISETFGGKTWGAFWVNNPDESTLDCVESIGFPQRELEPFAEISMRMSFRQGEGLPGRAWLSHSPVEIADVCTDQNFPRRFAAAECKLSNGVAIPIWHNDVFLGTFEFVAENKIRWDLQALDGLARQISQHVMRKKAEAEREHLVKIVEQSSDAIITIAENGAIKTWNKGAEESFLYRQDEIIGKNISVLMADEKRMELLRLVRSTLRVGERIESYETSLLAQDGSPIDVNLYGVPWFSDDNEYTGCSLTIQNITARKNAERRVSEFYSIVSHELRTPLTSIKGVLGLFDNDTVDADSPEGKELIKVALTSSDRLIRLINDMLDLKKIEAGKMELRKTRVDVEQLVSDCLASLQATAEEAQIKLAYDCAEPFNIEADWDKATQILTNLVSNAIKFSSVGGKVKVLTERSTKQCIKFRIIDNGPGISSHDLKRLFHKFQQIDSSDTRIVGGTGLGLAISKALVEEHGGSIGVSSQIGQGSEFWFEIKEYTREVPAPSKNEETNMLLDNLAI